MHNHGVDLTEGNILKHMIKFSLPMLAGNALQVLYNTVDSIWVGRFLGKEALGAVSVSFPIIFLLVSIVMGFGMATTVLVSQYAGAKDWDMVKRTVNNSTALIGIGGIIISVVGVVASKPILQIINTPVEILPLAVNYLAIFFSGLIFLFGFNILMAVFRGLGDAITPLKFLGISTVLNLLLDPLFIFVFKLHVGGAALATVISQGAAFFLGVWYLNKSGHILSLHIKELKMEKELIKTIVKLGFPSSVQQSMVSLGIVVLSAFINSFGPDVVAGYGAGSRIDSFALMPAMSLNVAVSSIVGQNIGAGKIHRVNESVKYGVLITSGITLVVFALVFMFAKPLLMLFATEPGVLKEGSLYLRIQSISYLFFGIMFIYNGALRGAGDVVAPMVITLLALWGIRIPLAWVLAIKAGYGAMGIWWGITISLFISMILSWAYYLSGKWRTKMVVKAVDS